MNVFLWVIFPTSASRPSWSATSGATATTSSAGRRAPRSSTRTGCSGGAARCSTSGCSGWWVATSSASSSRSRGPTRSASARPLPLGRGHRWAWRPASPPSSGWSSSSTAAARWARSSRPRPRWTRTMYRFLGLVIVLGMWNTIAVDIFGVTTTTARACRSGSAGSSPGTLHPELMVGAPLGFQLHALSGSPVRAVAVHPPGARLLGPGRLHHPAVHRLPQQGRARGHRGGHPGPEARLGAGAMTERAHGSGSTRSDR